MFEGTQDMVWDQFTSGRYRVMRELLSQVTMPDMTILDLGAGRDAISSQIKCRSHVLLDIVATTAPSVVCNFSHGLPLCDDSVDVVVAGEILEHMTESRRFLQEIRRVLRSGGWLVLSVPNIASLKYRLAFLTGRIPALAARADYTYEPDNPAYPRGHVRDYSFAEMRRVLADYGFRVVAERSNGMHINGRRIIPPWLMPVTFSDTVIVKAILQK